MKCWMIRHAVAVDADAFAGPDMERPLTAEGKRRARAAFARLAVLRDGPDVVITSAAVRARETAELLCRAYGRKEPVVDPRLNPGARTADIKKIVKEAGGQAKLVALVGHEPDFSAAISQWTSGGLLDLAMKKGALVELEIGPTREARLLMAIPPDLLYG